VAANPDFLAHLYVVVFTTAHGRGCELGRVSSSYSISVCEEGGRLVLRSTHLVIMLTMISKSDVLAQVGGWGTAPVWVCVCGGGEGSIKWAWWGHMYTYREHRECGVCVGGAGGGGEGGGGKGRGHPRCFLGGDGKLLSAVAFLRTPVVCTLTWRASMVQNAQQYRQVGVQLLVSMEVQEGGQRLVTQLRDFPGTGVSVCPCVWVGGEGGTLSFS